MIEIFQVTPDVSVFGKKDDDSKLVNFRGYLISPNDQFCWVRTKKQLTETEIENELRKLERPYLPGNIQPLIKQLSGQKSKKKTQDDVEMIEKVENDYSDYDEDEDEDDDDDEENDEVDEEEEEDIPNDEEDVSGSESTDTE